MAVVHRRRGLGDADPFAAFHAMETQAAYAVAHPPTAPVEQYRDFSTGQDLTVAEGRARLDASYRADAAANAASIANTPGYKGGGEDLIANEVAAQWAITRASQGFAPGDLASPVGGPIVNNPLHPVVFAPPTPPVIATPPAYSPMGFPVGGEGYHLPPGGQFLDANGGSSVVYPPGGGGPPAGAGEGASGSGGGVLSSPLVLGLAAVAAVIFLRKRS